MSSRYHLIPIFLFVFSLNAFSNNLQIESTLEAAGTAIVRVDYTNKPEDAFFGIEPLEVDYEEKYLLFRIAAGDGHLLNELYDDKSIKVSIDQQLTTKYTTTPDSCYRTIDEGYTKALELAQNHSSLASWIDIGDSWNRLNQGDGYDMMLLKLTNNAITSTKPITFITSSIHAEELPPAELMLRFAEHLLENYGVDSETTTLLDYHEIHLLLYANPDSRKLVDQGEHLRKNQNVTDASCSHKYGLGSGVDLNRNFAYTWNTCESSLGCSSDDPCSSIYRGLSPASEPETQAVVNYLNSVFQDVRGNNVEDSADTQVAGLHLDMHSSGEQIFYPLGVDQSANETQLKTLARKLAWFNNYTPQHALQLHPKDGTINDHVYGDLGIPSLTYELARSANEDCEYFESSLVPQNIDSLYQAVKTSRAAYTLPKGPDVTNIQYDPSTGYLKGLVLDNRFNNVSGQELSQNIQSVNYLVSTCKCNG